MSKLKLNGLFIEEMRGAHGDAVVKTLHGRTFTSRPRGNSFRNFSVIITTDHMRRPLRIAGPLRIAADPFGSRWRNAATAFNVKFATAQ